MLQFSKFDLTLDHEPNSLERALCIIVEEHLVVCHRRVVAILDEAERLGFRVTVHDEGEYWETRSVERLLRLVGHSNRILAHFAGALHDQLGPEYPMEAEIFKRR